LGRPSYSKSGEVITLPHGIDNVHAVRKTYDKVFPTKSR
jgi:hypothetical protein